eukprot:9574552-Lingulodinium_polyedra.AAC.1
MIVSYGAKVEKYYLPLKRILEKVLHGHADSFMWEFSTKHTAVFPLHENKVDLSDLKLVELHGNTKQKW